MQGFFTTFWGHARASSRDGQVKMDENLYNFRLTSHGRLINHTARTTNIMAINKETYNNL